MDIYHLGVLWNREVSSLHIIIHKTYVLKKKHREKIEKKGASTLTSFWGILFVWIPVEDGALQ